MSLFLITLALNIVSQWVCEKNSASIRMSHPAHPCWACRAAPGVRVTFQALCFAAIVIGILALAILLGDILRRGVPSLNWNFLTSFPSRFANQAGLLSALWVRST